MILHEADEPVEGFEARVVDDEVVGQQAERLGRCVAAAIPPAARSARRSRDSGGRRARTPRRDACRCMSARRVRAGPVPAQVDRPRKPHAGSRSAKLAPMRFQGGTITLRKRPPNVAARRALPSTIAGASPAGVAVPPSSMRRSTGCGVVPMRDAVLQHGHIARCADPGGGCRLQPVGHDGQGERRPMPFGDGDEPLEARVVAAGIVIAPPQPDGRLARGQQRFEIRQSWRGRAGRG